MSSSRHLKILMVTAILFAVTLTARAQQCVPCDIGPVAALDSAKATLTYARLSRYLCTLHKACLRGNKEYSEYANEVLFTVLEKDPEMLLRAIAHAPDLDTATIFRVMADPLSDPDVSRPIAKLKSGENDALVRRRMIAILEKIKAAIDAERAEDSK